MCLKYQRFTLVFICAVALASCAGGGGSNGSVVPNPPSSGGGTYTVTGFPAKFTEYPLPSGITPVDVTIGPDGALWFGNFSSFDSSTTSIGQVKTTGAIKTFTLPMLNTNNFGRQPFSGSGAIASAGGTLWSIATDPAFQDESLLVSTTPAGSASFPGDLGTCCGSPVTKIIVGPDGNLWLSVCFESCPEFSAIIESFTTAGTRKVDLRLGDLNTGATFQANSLASGPDKNVYATVVYTGTPGANPFSSDSLVFQISTSGTVLHEFPLANGSGPTGIVTGPDKNLWIAETGSSRIAKMDTSGNVTEFSLPAANAGPQMIVAGTDGALWFTEDPGNNLGRITTSGTVTEYPIPTANSHPFGLATCPAACENAHGRIWFAEKAGKIAKFEF